MNTRSTFLLAAILLLSLFLSPTVGSSASPNAKRAKTKQMLAMLPASDMVMTMDVARFFEDALPKILSSNQPMLADMMSKIDSMREKTGIDLRQFEFLTVGLNVKFVSEKQYVVEPVMLARGSVSSQAVIAAAKQAANGRYKEESINGKTIFTFPMAGLAKKARTEIEDDEDSDAAEPAAPSAIEKIFLTTSSDVSVSAVDTNTVALGTPDRVRALIEARTRVGSDIAGLLDRKPFAVLNFAGKMPAGLKSYLPLESDDLGESIDAIRYAYGNMDVAEGQVSMSLSARLERSAQSEQLYDTLDLLKSFAGGALGSSKRPDQQLYARLIQNVKLSRNGSEISIDLTIPQGDVDLLMAMLTK